MQHIQAQYDSLTAAQQRVTALLDYREQVCRLFLSYGVLFQVERVEQASDMPWLELYELVDLDDSSGERRFTVRACALMLTPVVLCRRQVCRKLPSYAQHQCAGPAPGSSAWHGRCALAVHSLYREYGF